MHSIFKKSVELNLKIEKFMDTISNSLDLFEKAIQQYLSDENDRFQETMNRICTLESEADALEVDIKVSIYKFLLLPDARADVLSLIKSLDDIIDATKEISKELNIQKPTFPSVIHNDIKELTVNTIKSSEILLLAARSFFNEVHLVSSYVSKVRFFEHEADLIEDKLNNKIFNGNIVNELGEKMQLKYFTSKISGIADTAEVIGDKLTIFTIKREI